MNWKDGIIIFLVLAVALLLYLSFLGNGNIQKIRGEKQRLETVADSVDNLNQILILDNEYLDAQISKDQSSIIALEDNYNALQSEIITLVKELNQMRYESVDYSPIDNYEFFDSLFTVPNLSPR